MKLTGELKGKVEKTKNMEDAKKIIEEAGMILNDAELDQVAGGFIAGKVGDSYPGTVAVDLP